MKRTLANYVFNAAAKTITLSDFATINLESILLITNVTRGIIIYQFNDSVKGGTVATNVLTLTFDTTGQSNTDKLNIVYEDFNIQPINPNAVISATGSLTAVSQAVSLTLDGQSNTTFQLSGTWIGTVQFQASNNGTNWTNIFAYRAGDSRIIGSNVNDSTNNDIYRCTTAGFGFVRVLVTAYTSGTIVVNANSTNTTSGVFLNFPLPVGRNNIGTIEISDSHTDIHGQSVGVTRITQLSTKFFQQPPSSFLTINTTGTGATIQGVGTGIFSTGTGTTSSVSGQTPVTILYAAQYEAWAVLSSAFTTPTSAASSQRIGVYNSVDGFAFGYNGLTFGLWTRFNSVDSFIAQTAWNTDTANGNPESLFRNNNTPVALVPTNLNMYRIRYGWYGSVDTYFEIYEPDGNWITVHKVKTVNVQTAVNLTNPNLPLTVEVIKTASDATNLAITCGGWAAGISAPSSSTAVSGQQNITALNGNISLPTNGMTSLAFSITGTWIGTLSFQYSLDGINWTTHESFDTTFKVYASSTTINRTSISSVGSFFYYRVIATAWTSGTASIAYNGTSEASDVVPPSASPLFKGRASSFRIPGRAGTTGQNIMSIHNASGSAINLVVNKITVDLLQTVVKAITVAPLIIRMWKITVLPTNGTALTKTKIGGTTTSNASVTVLCDASTDGTNSGTTLTATKPIGTFIEQQYAQRFITAAGYEMADELDFFQGTEVVLGALEGIVVFLDYTLATQNPTTDQWLATVEWEEKAT